MISIYEQLSNKIKEDITPKELNKILEERLDIVNNIKEQIAEKKITQKEVIEKVSPKKIHKKFSILNINNPKRSQIDQSIKQKNSKKNLNRCSTLLSNLPEIYIKKDEIDKRFSLYQNKNFENALFSNVDVKGRHLGFALNQDNIENFKSELKHNLKMRFSKSVNQYPNKMNADKFKNKKDLENLFSKLGRDIVYSNEIINLLKETKDRYGASKNKEFEKINQQKKNDRFSENSDERRVFIYDNKGGGYFLSDDCERNDFDVLAKISDDFAYSNRKNFYDLFKNDFEYDPAFLLAGEVASRARERSKPVIRKHHNFKELLDEMNHINNEIENKVDRVLKKYPIRSPSEIKMENGLHNNRMVSRSDNIIEFDFLNVVK